MKKLLITIFHLYNEFRKDISFSLSLISNSALFCEIILLNENSLVETLNFYTEQKYLLNWMVAGDIDAVSGEELDGVHETWNERFLCWFNASSSLLLCVVEFIVMIFSQLFNSPHQIVNIPRMTWPHFFILLFSFHWKWKTFFQFFPTSSSYTCELMTFWMAEETTRADI